MSPQGCAAGSDLRSRRRRSARPVGSRVRRTTAPRRAAGTAHGRGERTRLRYHWHHEGNATRHPPGRQGTCRSHHRHCSATSGPPRPMCMPPSTRSSPARDRGESVPEKSSCPTAPGRRTRMWQRQRWPASGRRVPVGASRWSRTTPTAISPASAPAGCSFPLVVRRSTCAGTTRRFKDLWTTRRGLMVEPPRAFPTMPSSAGVGCPETLTSDILPRLRIELTSGSARRGSRSCGPGRSRRSGGGGAIGEGAVPCARARPASTYRP